jgi:rhodanese-related sulfurtransferase
MWLLRIPGSLASHLAPGDPQASRRAAARRRSGVWMGMLSILTQCYDRRRMQHNPGFLKLVDDARSRVRQIDIEGYKKMVAAGETHVLVDTREDNEWDKGHVRGAVHLSRGIIERDIETRYPDKATPLVLYCGGGFRSALAADNLQKMGYTGAISLDGGWRALKESGLPLE